MMRAHGPRLAFGCLLLALAGCRQDIQSGYGQRKGPTASLSVNGTAVLAEMFERAGHSVFSWLQLSPRLRERADCIVWFPDDFQPPAENVRQWLDEWLEQSPGRTLIYVGRDFDAAAWYWEKIEPGAPAEQIQEIRSRKRAASADFGLERRPIPDSEDCGWFTVEREHPPRQVRTLQGESRWLKGVDPSKLGITLNGRLLPSPDASVVLQSNGDALVSVEQVGQSRRIVVANGSFLLNLPLVNREHRKLAGRLIHEIGSPQKTVVFLESSAGGPTIADKDPSAAMPTGMEILHVWPTNWILLHLAVAGIILCFSRFPIFGLPYEPKPEGISDFGRHIQALGELLRRSGDTGYAMARLLHYQQSTHPESAGPHRNRA